MRPTFFLFALAGAASLPAFSACNDDGGNPATGVTEGDAGPPPSPSPYGLDTRPSNTTCIAPARPKGTADVTLKQVFAKVPLATPLTLLQPPGDRTRFWVGERAGALKSFDATNDGTTDTTLVLDLAAAVNGGLQLAGEGGFLGFAFHPKFAANHQVFVSYTMHSKTGGADMRSVISRFTSKDGGKTLDPTSEQILLSFDQPFTNHDGGHIEFGPDGYLYIGFGDGGSGGDPYGNGENRDVLFGKMLRIDVDGPAPYGVPADNPFANGGGAKEIYAWGLRNPWRFSFDTGTGQLWVGDVGQDTYEEIDRVQLGGDYGWNCREGLHPYPKPAAACAKLSTFVDPIVEYPHAGKSKSVTGGYVYRGKAIPALVGTYFYGDFVTGEIWELTFDANGKAVPLQINAAGPTFGLPSFAQDLDGEVYALDFGGKIYEIVPNATGGGPDSFPQKLSQTGCVDPANPSAPAAGLVPYGVNAPLWSDGAEKRRYFAVPDGKTIHVNDDGDWDFPIGSVLVKTFALGGKPVETRLFVRHDDGGWGGYSYAWNDAGTDADLLPSSMTKTFGAQTWYYPSRNECGTCHTAASGYSLGLETGQLDGDFVYPSTNRVSNQLATLEHVGLLDATPAPGAAPYPSPTGTGPVDARARAYLHANCSMCHRPGSTAAGVSMDLRFATKLADAKLCDVAPQAGDLGVAGAKLVAAGDPSRSVVSLRTHSLGPKRMPPLASSVVDEAGTKVLDDWIAAIKACP